MRLTLLHLFNLVFENISAIGVEDRWLVGQINTLLQATRKQDKSVKRADHAMYLAKRAGKNRVFAAG